MRVIRTVGKRRRHGKRVTYAIGSRKEILRWALDRLAEAFAKKFERPRSVGGPVFFLRFAGRKKANRTRPIFIRVNRRKLRDELLHAGFDPGLVEEFIRDFLHG